MSDQLQLRRDTLANIQTATPAQGEAAFATDSGEIYVGDGATPGGVHQALGVFAPGFAAGRYYSGAPSSANTTALTANTLYAVPFFCFQKVAFSKISIEITTAGGTNGRLGVFAWGTNGLPSTRFLDAGLTANASTGVKEITGLAINLSPGIYGLAFMADANVSVRVGAGGGQLLTMMAFGASAPNISPELCAAVSQSFGAMPASFPASGISYIANYPFIGLRL